VATGRRSSSAGTTFGCCGHGHRTDWEGRSAGIDHRHRRKAAGNPAVSTPETDNSLFLAIFAVAYSLLRSHREAVMILLTNVLVATDFNEPSDTALVYGRALAREFGGTLHLLHVAENFFFRPISADPQDAQVS